MLELTYDSISRYFSALSTFGYFKYYDVSKLLLLLCVEDLAYNDFYGYFTEDDYRTIERVLSSIFCTTCIIPYPKYTKQMNNLFLGSITELAYRQKKTERELASYQEQTDNSILEIQNTKVIKGKGNESTITDITPTI